MICIRGWVKSVGDIVDFRIGLNTMQSPNPKNGYYEVTLKGKADPQLLTFIRSLSQNISSIDVQAPKPVVQKPKPTYVDLTKLLEDNIEQNDATTQSFMKLWETSKNQMNKPTARNKGDIASDVIKELEDLPIRLFEGNTFSISLYLATVLRAILIFDPASICAIFSSL